MRKFIAVTMVLGALMAVVLGSQGAHATEGCIIPVTDNPSCDYNAGQEGGWVAAGIWTITVTHNPGLPNETVETFTSSDATPRPVTMTGEVIHVGDAVHAEIGAAGFVAIGNAEP